MEITHEMEEAIYRKVKREYAAEDVRGVLEDEEINPDEYEFFDKLVDAYDNWYGGYDGEWYEAIIAIKNDIEWQAKRQAGRE